MKTIQAKAVYDVLKKANPTLAKVFHTEVLSESSWDRFVKWVEDNKSTPVTIQGTKPDFTLTGFTPDEITKGGIRFTNESRSSFFIYSGTKIKSIQTEKAEVQIGTAKITIWLK